MKYRLLLVGNGTLTIDDFFAFLTGEFDFMTSSLREADIRAHVTMFQPNMIVYCMRNEHSDHIQMLASLKPEMKEDHIYLAVIGNDADCREFKKHAGKSADMMLYMPITAGIIRTELSQYLAFREEQIKQDRIRQENRRLEQEAYQKQLEEQIQARENGTEVPLQASASVTDSTGNSALDALMAYDALLNTSTAQKKLILVIDRDAQTLKFIKDQLHMNYDVATAISGNFAMKLMNSKKVDLILLNLEMPTENGATILSMIRSSEVTKSIPLVFMTSSTDRAKIQRALLLRPQGYLLKPLNAQKLTNTVNKLI